MQQSKMSLAQRGLQKSCNGNTVSQNAQLQNVKEVTKNDSGNLCFALCIVAKHHQLECDRFRLSAHSNDFIIHFDKFIYA